MTRTFAMIKPDAMKKGFSDPIISALALAGFDFVDTHIRYLTREEAEWLYRSSKEKSHFGDLIDFTISSPVMLMVLERVEGDAVEKLRELMGPYAPDERIPGTLRFRFGGDSNRENGIHGSATAEEALLEIQYFFGS